MKKGIPALRMFRILAPVLGDQNIVIEDVAIEMATRGRNKPQTTRVLVFLVRPKTSQASRCSRC
ncbi:hypothetical protein AWC15_14480 [Mycobacterium lacus]|uniref:Uncharacterized protein n=2 Tax=Mycobacterium lacus TaxID=169765 RepID=A0A1X1YR97_9MYCO|nr:hypothetical protein AWC15_14480 [Mycobacterium lacus]BBX98196.1 hypothetical protein MLAC_34900 [Mycobacterium lacus]